MHAPLRYITSFSARRENAQPQLSSVRPSFILWLFGQRAGKLGRANRGAELRIAYARRSYQARSETRLLTPPRVSRKRPFVRLMFRRRELSSNRCQNVSTFSITEKRLQKLSLLPAFAIHVRVCIFLFSHPFRACSLPGGGGRRRRTPAFNYNRAERRVSFSSSRRDDRARVRED